MPKVQDLIQHLQKDFNPDDVIAYHIWSIDDIEGEDLSDVEKGEIIEEFDRHCDSQYGLTWDGLFNHIDDWRRDNNRPEPEEDEDEEEDE